ncbi:probable G-protein coupled receptor frpr-1 [Liolophura sinensis]|uniref:probable G-protein coupled receptor frpr-1 n=1 Tax=Liolophura sinensis TaxID=3198878 RepID=UPI003158ABA2
MSELWNSSEVLGVFTTMIPFSVHDEGLISQSTKQTVEFALVTVFLPMILLLGCLGNGAVLRTLWNQKPRQSLTVYLLSLSVNDTVVVLAYAAHWIINIVCLYDPEWGNKITAAMTVPVYLFLLTAAQRVTGVLTSLLTMERVLAVTCPLTVKSLLLSRHPRKIVTAVYLFCYLYMVPNWFRYNVSLVVAPSRNASYVFYNLTKFARTTDFYRYYGLLAHILMSIIPMIVVLCGNLTIIITMKRRKNFQDTIMFKKSEEHKVTTLLLCVSFIFLICTIPGTCVLIVTKYNTDFGLTGRERHLFDVLLTISFILVALNSSVNFIVYMICSSRFRKTFTETWRCCQIQKIIQ